MLSLPTMVAVVAMSAFGLFHVAMLVVSDEYRDRILDAPVYRLALGLAAFLVVCYVVVTAIGCASASAPSQGCSSFAWGVAGLVVLAVAAAVLVEIYLAFLRKDGKTTTGSLVRSLACGT